MCKPIFESKKKVNFALYDFEWVSFMEFTKHSKTISIYRPYSIKAIL